MTISVFARLVAVAAGLGSAIPALAQDYTFVNIADTTGPLASFSNPVINNAGLVAFRAQTDTNGRGIFAGDGGPVFTVSDEFPSMPGDLSINDAGQVAFVVGFASSSQAIYRADAGVLTLIAHHSGAFTNVNNVSINNHGEVAFFGFMDNGRRGIYKGSGGAVTTIAEDGPGSAYSNLTNPSINDDGLVAFEGSITGGLEGVLAGDGGPVLTLADTNSVFDGFHPFKPSMNDHGDVAFHASLDGPGEAIMLVSGGVATPVVDTNTSDLNFLGPPGLNNAGLMAFSASRDNGQSGMYVMNPSGEYHQLFRLGGPMFGSTISEWSFVGDCGINDAGDVVFTYRLFTGVRGVAVARAPRPPECPADLAPPAGVVDVFDFLAFLDAYAAGEPMADVAGPFGVIDVFDLLAFMDLFTAGCG